MCAVFFPCLRPNRHVHRHLLGPPPCTHGTKPTSARESGILPIPSRTRRRYGLGYTFVQRVSLSVSLIYLRQDCCVRVSRDYPAFNPFSQHRQLKDTKAKKPSIPLAGFFVSFRSPGRIEWVDTPTATGKDRLPWLCVCFGTGPLNTSLLCLLQVQGFLRTEKLQGWAG